MSPIAVLRPLAFSIALVAPAARAAVPEVVETRTIALTQTVTLKGIPEGAGTVRLWVPIPSDAPWQRVLDRKVESAPGTWSLVPQAGGRGDFVVVDVAKPASPEASVVVSCVVQRQGVKAAGDLRATGPVAARMFPDELDAKARLMEPDDAIRAMAAKAVGAETDPARKALLLMQAVAAHADHYSKNPEMPKCTRGSSVDCMERGGGCCTDLHSLFIAAARSQGVPARIQFGYRTLDAKAGAAFDPTYRCWVEFFVPGSGWIPTDIVAADGAAADHPAKWASLSATRVWLWSGRDFELTPPASAGRIPTMTCGWAEIDGKAVDPLPAADGSPSLLTRTVKFDVVANDRTGPSRLPE